MWGSSLGELRKGSERRRKWLVVFGLVVLVLACVAAPASYGNTKVYFTGDKVTAQVTECHWSKGGRRSRGSYRCTGSWDLRDGTHGSGLLRGVNDRLAKGAKVPVRATAKTAIEDDGPWAPITFGVGVLAILTTIGLATMAGRRYFRTRTNQLAN